MNKFTSALLAVVGIVSVIGLGARDASASHKWSTYHWARTTNPFNLLIVNNLNAEWSKYLVGAYPQVGTVSQWNDPKNPLVLDAGSTPRSRVLTVALAQTSGTAGDCNAVSGKTVVCNGAFGNNGWLGLAQIWLSGSHIVQGTAQMNDTYFSSPSYNNANQKLHVVCQEVAHTFGLGHQSTTGQSINTCMDYFSNTGLNATSTRSTWPNTHDFGMLGTIYNHADAGTTVASATAAVAAVPKLVNDKKDWGRLVSQGNSGRHSVYERVFPNGVRVMTDVLWTDEIAAACPTCDHRSQRAP